MTIRIGIVGSGNMATTRAGQLMSRSGTKIAAVASQNESTGRMLAVKTGGVYCKDWRDLVDRGDLDAIGVFTYNSSHGEISIASLQAGKHLFCEYPCCRTMDQAETLARLIAETDRVVAIPHREPFSAAHRALKDQIEPMLPLMASVFVRLTPGRGMRPEVLFNLKRSGPPALFFVYHVFPLVDCFGPARWVESAAVYRGLREDQSYESFSNALTVGFAGGGFGQWHWSGGIRIKAAEEYQRMILSGGSFSREDGVWKFAGCETIGVGDEELVEERIMDAFLDSIRTGNSFWKPVARDALEATRIGLAAELAQQEGRRIAL